LHQIWKAFAAYDKSRGLTPTASEYQQRDMIEQTLKRIAGLLEDR
jgi:hypothetical protein